MPRPQLLLAALGLLVISACGSDTSERTPVVPAFLRPPPRPGESINSTMCSCRACSKADCCGGAAEPGAGEGSKHCENYDFGAPGCELSVASCSARCYEEVWRVQAGQTCDLKRPAVCCESGAQLD